MKWSIALLLMTLLSAFLSIQAAVIPVASGVPEEAVGRVVSVISGEALGVQMLISDPRTNNVDSIKLADIASPSTVTPEGKAAQKYARSLLWNKTVYLDIDNSTSSGRNEWSQLICVVYLVDSEYRPIWPPVNRIIVDAGYAKVDDDKKNEFDPGAWWKEPTIPEGEKENLTRDIAEKKAETNATNASSINSTRNFNSLRDMPDKKAATNATNASSINNTRIFSSQKDIAEKKAATNATNASSINNTRIFNSLKDVAEKKATTNATNASSINKTRIFSSRKDIAEKKATTNASSINDTRDFTSLKDVAEKKAETNATNASLINDTRNFTYQKSVAEKKAATNATNAPSINKTRISNSLKDIAEKKAVTGGRVTVVDTAKSSILQRDSKTGRVSIGYRA